MCGIVAVFSFSPSGLYAKDIEIFEQLHKVIALRGEDGAGVFYVGDKKSGLDKLKDDEQFSSYVKCATNPYDLHVSKELLGNLPIITKSRFLVGHVRYATQGNVITANAHPFVSNNKEILLVHNGNIHSAAEVKNVKKFPVDSMALAESLARASSVKESLNNTFGAIATIWYNRKDKTINIYRNHERPLHYVEYLNTWYIASEVGALQWVLKRNHTAAHCPIHEFEDVFHYKWDHTGKLEKERVKEVYRYHRGQDGVWEYGGEDCGYYQSANQPIILSPPKPDPAPESEPLPSEILSKEEPQEKKKLKPIDNHMGIKRGDIIFFEVINDILTDSAKNRFAIDGSFVGTNSSTVMNYGLFEDLLIHCTLKSENRDELERQMKKEFFQGIVASILLNQDDATEVRVYVKDARVLTEEEKIKYWKANQICLSYRADFAPERVIH